MSIMMLIIIVVVFVAVAGLLLVGALSERKK